MAWDAQEDRSYYSRSRRVNGKICREYVGNDEYAQMHAELDRISRLLWENFKLRLRAAIEAQRPLRTLIRAFERQVQAALRDLTKTLDGIDSLQGRSNAIPRRRKLTKPEVPPTWDERDWQDALKRARKGDPQAFESIKKRLADRPDFFRDNADLTGEIIAKSIQQIAGPDLIMAEGLKQRVADYRSELLGDSPRTLERMMVELAVVALLQANYWDYQATAQRDAHSQVARMVEKQHTAAHRRFQLAVKGLQDYRQQMNRPLQPENGCGAEKPAANSGMGEEKST